jgi:hypothetical protein
MRVLKTTLLFKSFALKAEFWGFEWFSVAILIYWHLNQKKSPELSCFWLNFAGNL